MEGEEKSWFMHACLDTFCSHFLAIIAGADFHFGHECQTGGLNQGRRGWE